MRKIFAIAGLLLFALLSQMVTEFSTENLRTSGPGCGHPRCQRSMDFSA